MSSAADDTLIVRYLEGAASDEEVALLEQRLRDDGGARREFVRLSHLMALFVDLPQRQAAAPRVRRRRGWLLPAAAALAAAALIAIAGGVLLPAGFLPVVSALHGTVVCARAQALVPLQVQQRLADQDLLTVSELATLELQWPDGAQVTVAGDSVAAIGGRAGATMSLARGELHAVVHHDGPRPAFAIATPEGIARDIGTDFLVRRLDDRTIVIVRSGLVEFIAPQGALSIPAGHWASIMAGQAPRLDADSSPAEVASPTSPVVAAAGKPAADDTAPAAPAPGRPAPDHAQDGSVTVTGSITGVTPDPASFTLSDDATGLSAAYRPYYAGGHGEAIAASMRQVRVGDRVTVAFVEREGRRVVTVAPAGPAAAPPR